MVKCMNVKKGLQYIMDDIFNKFDHLQSVSNRKINLIV